jgi:hypothetical protein
MTHGAETSFLVAVKIVDARGEPVASGGRGEITLTDDKVIQYTSDLASAAP